MKKAALVLIMLFAFNTAVAAHTDDNGNLPEGMEGASFADCHEASGTGMMGYISSMMGGYGKQMMKGHGAMEGMTDYGFNMMGTDHQGVINSILDGFKGLKKSFTPANPPMY